MNETIAKKAPVKGAGRKTIRALAGVGLGLLAVHAANVFVEGRARARQSKRPKDGPEICRYESRYGTLRYKKAGRGKPLVLLHGLHTPLGLCEWDGAIGLLSSRYTVYALEFPGYGYSDKPLFSYSAYMLASLTADFIRDVAGAGAYAAAAGGGGGVALAASLMEQGLIERLLLVSPIGAGSLRLKAKGFTKGLFGLPIVGRAVYNALNSKAAAGLYLRRVFVGRKTATGRLAEDYNLAAHHNYKGAKRAYAAAMANYMNTDLSGLIKKASLPVRLVWGSDDPLNPAANGTALQNESQTRLPMAVLPGSKHFPHMDDPKGFYRVCLEFFG